MRGLGASVAVLAPAAVVGAAFAFAEGADAASWVALGVLVGAATLCVRAVARGHHADLDAVEESLRGLSHDSPWDSVVPIRALDEVGALARAVDSLHTRVVAALDAERAALDEARAADVRTAEFLASVSHELKTPLNAVLGFAQVLLQEVDGPLTASQREDVETIRAAGTHLAELFDDVIDLTAMASGRLKLAPEGVPIEPFLSEVARLLAGQKKAAVELEVEVEAGCPPVRADRVRLRQIVMNLGTNALKFTERGRVTFAARARDGGVELAVRDTGAGIGRLELGSLFADFQQAGDARQRRQGFGLGLAICKRLVELHGGTIEVESELGRGSTFRVWFPSAGPA